MEKILIGTDPELFVSNGKEFISAHDLIPGTKIDPYIVRGGAVQVDGVAAEFNINPAADESEFYVNICLVRERLDEMIKAASPDYRTVCTPVATFTEEYFKTIPPEALRLGCEPDFNAYTGKRNHPPKTTEPFRTGAGHLHVGWTRGEAPNDSSHVTLCRDMVRQLDAMLYPLSHMWDSEQKRRELYGARGSFRPKSYGVEYRPLSNAYLQSEETIRLVYRATYAAADLLLNKGMKLYES